jgi:hypothetical protein
VEGFGYWFSILLIFFSLLLQIIFSQVCSEQAIEIDKQLALKEGLLVWPWLYIYIPFILKLKSPSITIGLLGLTCLSLSTDKNTCKTVFRAYGKTYDMSHVHKFFSSYFHKLSGIGYETLFFVIEIAYI